MKKDNINSLEYQKALEKSKVQKIRVEDEMKKSFIAYAMAVNVSRAIPDVRDGLKPVHRRIMFAMGELGMFSDKPFKKSARIVGEVLGKYHPHGDSAVYDAMVRMAQDFSINEPLIDGQGNFGSVDGDPAAASRYTEAMLSKIAAEMLKDIDKNTVDHYPNFDESLQQPTVLPAKFPNLLVNGSDGIAVGMATNIPPHNLGEVIDGVLAYIDNPEITPEELMTIIPAPDYPTGGILMGRAAVKYAYKTGRGGVIIRAKTDIEENGPSARSKIVVTELPYQVNKSRLIENIAEMARNKKLEGIANINDESDRTGLRIVIEVKREANAQVVLNALYKHTQLQISNGINLLALHDGQPKVMPLKEILEHYVTHQKDVLLRKTKFDLEKAEGKAHILEGLMIAQDNIDKVIAIMKKGLDKVTICEELCSTFFLTDKQANAIAEMRLYKLSKLEVESLKNDLAEIHNLITELKSIINSPQKMAEIIKSDLSEIKERFATPRKTEISMDMGEIDIGDLIEQEDVVISLTHFGYIKRMPTTEYRTQRRGGRGVTAHKTKEEDFVETMFISNTHDELLFFTNKGKVYNIKGYEVPEAQKTARGRAIVNLLQLSDGEKVTTIIPLKEGTTGNLLMATKHGLIKKTDLTAFSSIRKVGKICISLVGDDELISVDLSTGYDEILVATHEGKCIRFSEEEIRSMGREAQGVRSIKLAENDFVVDATIVKNGCEVLTLSENGYGKLSDISDYRLQSRGGKGIKAGVFNKKTGNLVNLKLVHITEDIMLIADNGVIIRVKAKEISKIGRDTLGVRVMKFKDSDAKVVCVATAPPEADVIDGEDGETAAE